MTARAIREKAGCLTAASRPVMPGIGRRLLGLVQQVLRTGSRRHQNLRVCDSVSLGERRFVAVVAYKQSHFLIGGTASSLSLLARLEVDPGDGTAPQPAAVGAPAEGPTN